MSEDRSFKNTVSYIATASSTLIGVLGLFFTVSNRINIREFFVSHQKLVSALIAVLGVVVGGFVTRFVDAALRRKGGAGD